MGRARTAGTAGISDDAVRAKTGKTWSQWLKTLDADNAKRLTHKEIAAHLHKTHKLSPWWAQMVTVGYEQARGMRAKHQKPDGYSVSASRTIGVNVGNAYALWNDARARRGWLGESGLKIRKATPKKSMRITWTDGKTSVEVNFYAKGTAKSQVVVQHSKLESSKEAARKKAFWRQRLDALKTRLES